nr:hypothetical protein BaRGS_033515 [Batillaria attramentaria]
MSHGEGNEVIVWLTIFFICVAGLQTEASQPPSRDLDHRHKRQSDRKNQKKDPLDLPGIWCYQCVDLNSNQSFCALGHELVKTQVTVREKVAQDLNAISGYGFQQCGLWYPYCVIEEHYFGEKNTSATYTRDCANTQRKFENMNITLDNKTRCTWNVELKGQACTNIWPKPGFELTEEEEKKKKKNEDLSGAQPLAGGLGALQ